MRRVVDILPGRAEMAASGLAKGDYTVDREIYRHFVGQCSREFADFKSKFHGDAGEADRSPDADGKGGLFVESDEAWIDAFNRSRPPFCYHRGSFYRYRIDRSGPEERPIILESAERSEVTGSFAGIPISSEHRGLLIRLCDWIERKLGERKQRRKG